MRAFLGVLILVGLTYWGHHHRAGTASADAAAQPVQAAEAAAPQPLPAAPVQSGQVYQVYYVTQADVAYLNSYYGNVNLGRSMPFGSTTQNISLPSGTAIQVNVTKTKTGWCPIRHEPTFSFSMQTARPMSLKQ